MLNLNRLRKEDILYLFNHYCKHGHRLISHLSCVEESKTPFAERIGFLDIESSNLKASFGIVFSYCIKTLDGGMIARSVTPQDMKKKIYDKRLMQQFIQDCRQFDRLVGYYSSRFDLPFLRSRCLFYNLEFPLYKEVKTTDVYDIVKHKFCLHRNRLQTICDFLGIESKEHPIKYDVWLGAMGGDKKSLLYILKHNQEDVLSLEALYKRVINYSPNTQRSI